MVEQKYKYFLWKFIAKKQALQQGNQFFKRVEINGSAVFASFFFFFVLVVVESGTAEQGV